MYININVTNTQVVFDCTYNMYLILPIFYHYGHKNVYVKCKGSINKRLKLKVWHLLNNNCGGTGQLRTAEQMLLVVPGPI